MSDQTFTFGGVTSSTYGIYISGEGVFNAPARVYEMVDIPGRNGALSIDQKRYENIEVTYPAFNYEPTLAAFRDNLKGLRDALSSKIGYQRLTDTIHPDEYRLGIFAGGLNVNPIKYNTASEFDITFTCKPQRFLTSGETEQTLSVGNVTNTVTNPTGFASRPLLKAKGSGTIVVNGNTATITDISSSTTLYIDCELMEAYTMSGSAIVPANDKISFSTGEFPTLKAGSNTIKATTTTLSVTPRWWRI